MNGTSANIACKRLLYWVCFFSFSLLSLSPSGLFFLLSPRYGLRGWQGVKTQESIFSGLSKSSLIRPEFTMGEISIGTTKYIIFFGVKSAVSLRDGTVCRFQSFQPCGALNYPRRLGQMRMLSDCHHRPLKLFVLFLLMTGAWWCV